MKKSLLTTILTASIALAASSYAGSGHDDHNHGGNHGHDHAAHAVHDDHGHDHGATTSHDDHGHGHDDHHAPSTPEFEHKDYGSVAKAWGVLTASVADAQKAVDENILGTVHGIYPELAASAHYLLDHSDLEDDAKRTRLKAALVQLTTAIESFHEYSHSGEVDAKEASREVKKMQGALKLIEAYYPADQLQAK